MKDVKTNKKQKIVGAMISSILFGCFFLILIGMINYYQFTEMDKMPWLLYGMFMVLFIMPIVGLVFNLIERIKEINGGEEDEASKY